jgi:hypothetical protein
MVAGKPIYSLYLGPFGFSCSSTNGSRRSPPKRMFQPRLGGSGAGAPQNALFGAISPRRSHEKVASPGSDGLFHLRPWVGPAGATTGARGGRPWGGGGWDRRRPGGAVGGPVAQRVRMEAWRAKQRRGRRRGDEEGEGARRSMVTERRARDGGEMRLVGTERRARADRETPPPATGGDFWGHGSR